MYLALLNSQQDLSSKIISESTTEVDLYGMDLERPNSYFYEVGPLFRRGFKLEFSNTEHFYNIMERYKQFKFWRSCRLYGWLCMICVLLAVWFVNDRKWNCTKYASPSWRPWSARPEVLYPSRLAAPGFSGWSRQLCWDCGGVVNLQWKRDMKSRLRMTY